MERTNVIKVIGYTPILIELDVYKRQVFIICSATSGGNDLWQNAKETVTRTKETSQLKH